MKIHRIALPIIFNLYISLINAIELYLENLYDTFHFLLRKAGRLAAPYAAKLLHKH